MFQMSSKSFTREMTAFNKLLLQNILKDYYSRKLYVKVKEKRFCNFETGLSY